MAVLSWSGDSNGFKFGADTSFGYSVQGTTLRLPLETPLVGDEFQVNTYTTELPERYASVALMRDDGNFVVVWESYGSGIRTPHLDLSDPGSALQDATGTPLGGDEFQVNTYTTSYPRPVSTVGGG